MKFAAKRFISIILVIVMCMQALPMTVLAALIDNDPEYNEEILDALTDLVGSEDEAERYYALLDHYGLLDEDGNLSESWEIWMDGEQVTLDDIIAELESEDCDLDKYVLVDGTAITLGNIKTILEIEEYIEYLQKTYFDGHQWTKEQQANLASLVEQMETKGIRLTSENGDAEIVWPSGISHEAVVSFGLEEKSDGTVVITALLDGAVEGQEVSFDYEALTGSQPVYGSGMIIMTADESGTASEQFVINKGDLEDNFHSSAQLTYFIKLSNLEGALFENGYPNTLITAYTAPNTDKALMQKVKNAAPGFVGKFNAAVSSDVQKKEYSFHDGDNGDYAYGTAIDWGILNNIHIVTKIELDYEKAGGGTWSIADMSFLENWGDVNGRWYGATGRYKATLRGQTDAVVWQNADILVSANSRQLSMNILDYGSDYNQPLSEIMRTNKVLSVEARAVIDYMIDKSGSNYYRTDIAERTPRYAKPDYELRLYNAVDPWVNGISQHSQTGYAPGHYIPVVVQFNQIVDPNVTLTLNGEKYKSLESKESGVYTSTLTYLYEVKDVDDLNLYCEVGSFTSISGATNDTYTDDNGITMVWGTNIDTPYKPDAITEVSAEVTGDVADPVLEVSVGITDDEGLTQWIGVSEDENGKLYADGLSVSVDGGETLHNLYFESESFSDGLYADIPLDIASDRCDYVVELFLDNDLIVGKYASGSHSWAIELIEEADLTATLNVGSFFDENEENPVIFVEGEMGKIKATFELADGEYSFCDTSKVAVYGTEEAESADFVWKSSNTAVATIDDNGNVTPTGATGTTQITLTARNGGFGNNEVTVTATYVVGENTFDALNFKAGLSPFFTIPHDKLTVVDGKNAIVYWSSNITDKNGDEETTFDISVTLDGNDVYSMAVSGTVSEPHSFAEIPGEYLIYDYTGTSNTYEITVACEYSGVTYSDTASVTIEPLPAGVALAKLDSYYILDTAGTLPISWSVENLSRAEEDSLDSIFDFTVMRNNVEVENDVVLSLNNGSGSGIFNLTIEDIIATPDEPGSYREVYTVTIQAKNGTDSTWSYDSFLLYVYDEDALQIMVDGEKAQDSLFISNRETISSMSQEEILELERDIYLKNIISVNYGDYAWTEVADQIMWRSDKNSVATLNYQQGMMYNNIEDFSYTSYRPTTELGLSGLSGGSSLISAIHKLTGMEDTLDVTVETLEDKLYLLKCFPKARTKLQYKNAEDGDWITVYSDNNGEAAIYELGGIKSNIYCFADVDTDNNPATPTIPYIGIFYLNELETGEGDWTKLERYPLNNLNLHRAGYAYLYLKDENGAPYTGDIAVRAGIYVDGEYIDNAQFGFNKTVILESGEEDNIITLDKTGKLSVYMDSKAWGLDEEWLTEQNQVDYVFEIRALTEEIVEQEPDESGETSDEGSESSDEGGDVPVTRLVENNNYYPILYTVDATTNSDIYVGSGKAVVSFRLNETEEPHQFIAAQNTVYTGAKGRSSVLGSNSKIGPNNNFKESTLNTSVMWWGTEIGENPTLQLVNENDVPVCTGEGAYKIVQTPYEFTKFPVTNYSVTFNENTLEEIGLTSGKSTGLSLDFYSDGESISRHEVLPFRLINLIGVGNVEDAKALPEMLTNLGMSTDTNNKKSMDFGDQFVNVAMNFVATDSYSTGDSKLFSIQISPTSDPTKFLGFIEVNVGNMDEEEEPEQIFFVPTQFTSDEYGTDVGYTPGLNELMLITEKKTMDEYLTPNVTSGTVGGDNMTGERNLSGKFSGYMESLIYFDENSGEWEIQILNGGFELGAGASYTWTWNTTTGIVPTTMTLTIGGALEIGLDTLTVSYFNVQEDETGFGTDYLTELRIMLYVEFFAGVGFDYAVCAFKLGIFGRVTLDMRFQWLNRPYMDVEDDIYNVADGTHNDSYYEEITDVYGAPMGYWKSPNSKLDGQRFKADGQIGLKLVVRVLFISFEKVLFSFHFNLFDETTRDWETIQTNWEKNKAAQMSAISALLGRRSVSVSNVGGQQVISLNLAPTLESRDYVEQGSYWNDGSVSLFALDENNALQNLQYNSYPYANPVVSDDGAIVAFLSDMGSENVEDTKASFATRNEFGMYNEGEPIYNGDGYGDAQLALAGTGEFAVAAWARQTESVKKDAGSVLTAEDQIIMMNSSEIYAGVYDGNEWATIRLTNNQSSDVAPVVSANGNRAVVAWREVASSAANTTEDGLTELTSFTEKDMILYRIYDGEQWSEAFTLYNGTSGAVKGISAAMLNDGTAAITYTLDTDGDEVSITDRDVFYAVIDNDTGYVERTVRATNDAYLDENPLVTAVTFPNANDEEYFVLGWFSQQAVAKDTAAAMSNGASQTENDVLSDIRLMAFDGNGIYAPLMPDSISQAADAQNVEITSSFRFSKNSETINDLSILWVQRARELSENNAEYLEKDVLKAVKFYTFGQNDNLIGFTGAIDVAEMDEGTLIDHFDAYVSNPETNEIKAVILGTTYGADGVVTVTGETVGGDIVEYSVPSSTTSMYTATEVYQDKIAVSGVLADYETVKKGNDTEIMFAVKNNGIHAVSGIEITLNDGKGESQTTTFTNINLLPGGNTRLYANYNVPADEVVDLDYTVKATFDESEGAYGSAQTTETVTYRFRTTTQDLTTVDGTVYLDLPEVQITDAEIIRESDGYRKILVKLNNGLDASLAKDGRAVKVSFYSDSAYENPIDSAYISSVMIDDADELIMIDEGGYSAAVDFNVKEYLTTLGEEELQEIPEGGINVYIKAEALEKDDNGEYAALPDIKENNNYSNVLCESLWNGTDDVEISYIITKSTDECDVAVTVQNTRIGKEIPFSNIVVKLYDADRNMLAQKVYNPDNNGKMSYEERITANLTFGNEAKNAAFAEFEIVEFDTGDESRSNSKLAYFQSPEIPGLSVDSFILQENGTYRCDISYSEADSINLILSTQSHDATIYFSGDTGSHIASAQKLIEFPSEYPVFDTIFYVTAPDGNTTTYTLRIDSSGTPQTEYTVFFNSAEGSGTMEPEIVSAGSSYTLPECTFNAPEGFNFKAWSINGVEYPVNATVEITGNTTVKAVWTNSTMHSVILDDGNGTIISTRVIEGESYQLPDVPFDIPDGKYFDCWSIDGERKQVGEYIVVTKPVTAMAVWADKTQYTVSHLGNGGEGEMEDALVYENDTYSLPECTFTAPKGFKFKAWDIDGIEYTVGATVTVTDNTTVKAVWMDKSEFIIHHWRNGGEGEMDNVTVFEGGSYILPECAFTAPEGFKFKGWSIDDEEYPVGATVTVTDHLTLTAVWMEKDNYLITFDANGGSGSMSNVDVYEGEGYILPECTLTAPEGYKFMAWSIDGVEKAVGAFVDITKDTTVKALWTLKEIYTVTLDANGADGNVEPVTAAEGDSYTLPDCTFDAPYGFKFKTWSVNGKEMAAGEAFTVTGNTVIKAEWIEKTKYTITFEPGSYTGLGAASGTMNPVTVYEDENLYTLPQCGYTAPVGCRFAGWGVSLEGGHPYTYDAGDTIELTANAEACPAWEIRHFSIFVDCPTRDSIILPQRVSVLTKVSDVKRQISSTAKIPVENMVLSYAQKELDNDATLKDCGILNTETLQLVVEHTVTFAERIGLVGNNGKKVEIRVPEGEYTLPEYTDFEFTPPEGDVFTDWLAEGYTHLPGDTIEITSDIVIYATYGDTSDDIYGIHFFDSIDGYDHFWDNPTEFIDTQYVQMQESFRITPPAAPEKAGYVFDGWYFYDFFSSERFTDIAVETDKDYDFDYLLTYGTQIYAKYTPFELTVEESEAGYTATSLVGEIKEDAKYSWYHYKVVENSTVTDETVHKGEASANDGTYNPETLKWTPRVIVEEIEGETEYFYLPFYFTIDLAPGDVLIITPDDPEDFAEMYLSPYENTYYLKDYRRGNTFIFAMAEDSPADAYTLYSYSGETDDAGAPMASTTPIYAELRRYEVSEPVEGETDAVFGSGIVGEEYFVQVEYSDGTVVTSKPFIYEIVSASYEVGGVNDSYVYTGSQIMPEPVVTVTINDITGEPTVLDKADYEVIYGNNTTVAEGGYVTVKIKDKENEGKYIDIKTLYFDITEREQQAFNIDGAISATYGDEPVTLNAQGGSGNGEITWRITSGSEFAEISPNGDKASLNITGAGTVVIEAVKASDGNYSVAVDTHSVVISKADVTADLFTLTPPTDAIYSRSLKKASVTGSGEYGAITVRYYSDQALKNAANPVNVGTYYVGITTTGGENYNAVNVPMYVGSFDITEKTITVTADAKQRQYGNPNPVLTYKTEGLIDGDRLSGALTTTAYITSEVGEYEITQGSLTAGDNYIIDFESALLTITKSGKLTSPPISGRHSDNGSTYTYTVTKVAGAEYRMNGGEWQDSNIFADLTANQKYTFSIRLKETDNFEASDERSLTVDLGKIDGVGSVTILDWTYGEIASTPVIASTTNGIDNVTYLYESTDGKGYIGEVQPVNAGTYRLTVTFAATETHNEAKASADFTIFKAIPDITAPTNLTATYGDTIASVQLPEGWEWNVTDTAETVGDAGDNRFSVIYTHPEDPDNYNQVTDEVTIAVSPKEVTATVVLDAYSFVYSGSEYKPGVTVKDGEAIIPSSEYTVSYTNNVNAGKATVSITDVDGGNYTVSGSTSFEITKKTSVAIPGVEREFIRTVASAGNEINIEEMLPDDHGNVSYRLSDSSYTVLENVSIGTDGKLVFDTKTSDASASDTITVVVEMQNYTDVTVTVSVILNEKTTQSITGVSAAEGLVYNEKAQQGYTGTPTSEKYTGDYEITYTGRNNSYNSTAAPTNAGDYTVTFKIPDSELYYSGNVSINFTIAKAKAEISVDTAPIVSSYGEQLTLPNATTNFGMVTVDKASADMTEVGEYTVTYTVADNENYNGDTKTVKVTIVHKKITRPAQASAVTYTGDALIYAVIETDDYTVTNGVQTNANEDGYNVIIALKDKENTVWDDGTVTDLTHKFIINRKAIEAVAGVSAPVATQNAQTTVNGENYSGAAKWNPDVITFGYFTAYDVTLTLTANANYKFADTITLDGYSVSTNNGTTLVLTKTFDKTAKAKITSVTAPTVDKLAVYGTLEDALSVMPNTVIAVTEAGNTTLPIVWAVVGEYDKTPAVSNTFKWTASVGDYDANSQTLTGDITVENADALGVVNTGTAAEITYDGNTYDVSTLFTKDTNAGEASYEIVVLGTEGEGTGTLGNDGKTLTVTKAGVITVKMTTAANGAYAQGTAQTTLTVKLGTGVGDVTIEGWTYGENANAPVATSNTNGTDNVTYLYESTDDKGYNSNAAPTTAGAYKVTATFAATDLYVKAEDSAEFTIEKALPTVKTPPTASRVKKGNLLSKSTFTGGEMAGVDGEALDGTFAWKSPETEMNTRGNIEVTAVFTPNDAVNYETVDVTITVEVYTTSTGGSGISVITYYDVKFNTNGGSNVPAQSIRRNSTANEPKAPTKDGYTFEGWYTDAQCTKAYDFDAKVTKDITLYAKWSENKPIVPDECDGTKDDNCPSIAYGDLDTKAWYHLDVDYALEKGLMNGMGEGVFAPDGKLSRAMLVTILWRLEGKPVVNYNMTFEDVDTESWCTEAVRWAASEGIVLGHSAESFAPNDDITREQLATIIYRYEKYKGGGFTGAWMFRMDYADLDDVSEWSYEAMCWCTMNNIVNGKPGKLLDPLGYATRAEAAAMLHRYCERDK